MNNLFNHLNSPKPPPLLWLAWWRAVQLLRPACRRTTTFLWLAAVLAAFCLRPDLAGVTSLVRSLGLTDPCYYALLHFFPSPALPLAALTAAWLQTIRRLLGRRLVRINGRPVVLVNGLKRPKEGRKMPGVKSLHQESECNAKAPFIMGHSCQVVALLVQSAGACLGVPVAARSLLDHDHPLVTRVRSTAIAFFPPPKPKHRRRGRPRRYGHKTWLRRWFRLQTRFPNAPSPLYDDRKVTLRYLSRDLLWRSLGQLVRFVWVVHPTRGRWILLCTDLTMSPLDVIRLYGWRFKIEAGFWQAIHNLGAYAYHFWMAAMTPLHRGQGNQHLHRRSTAILKKFLARKIDPQRAGFHDMSELDLAA